jgi:hexosaminidase
MATLLLRLLFLLGSPVTLLTCVAAGASFPVNVWPKPTSMSWAEPHASVPVSPSFHIIVASSGNPYLVSAAERYAKLLFKETYRPIVRPAVNGHRVPSRPARNRSF